MRATKRDKSGGDSKDPVTVFKMPNPENTKWTRLNSGEDFGPEGQLTVKAAYAEGFKAGGRAGIRAGAEVLRNSLENPTANSSEATRQAIMAIDAHADAGIVGDKGFDKDAPDQGDRPRYSREMHDETADEDMSARDHLDEGHACGRKRARPTMTTSAINTYFARCRTRSITSRSGKPQTMAPATMTRLSVTQRVRS